MYWKQQPATVVAEFDATPVVVTSLPVRDWTRKRVNLTESNTNVDFLLYLKALGKH